MTSMHRGCQSDLSIIKANVRATRVAVNAEAASFSSAFTFKFICHDYMLIVLIFE